MRRRLVILVLAVSLPAAALASSDAGTVRVVAWASKASKTAIPPADAVTGGTYCTARPIRRLYAFIRFNGMRDKVPSSATWLFNNKKVFVFNFKWEDGEAGRTAFSLYRSKGALVEGSYEIEVRSGGRLLGAGMVKLAFSPC